MRFKMRRNVFNQKERTPFIDSQRLQMSYLFNVAMQDTLDKRKYI